MSLAFKGRHFAPDIILLCVRWYCICEETMQDPHAFPSQTQLACCLHRSMHRARASRWDRIGVIESLVVRGEVVVQAGVDDLPIIALEARAGDVVRQRDVPARADPAQIIIEADANVARLLRADAATAQAQSQMDDAELAHEQVRMEEERSPELGAKGFAVE